jgi:hypothetical protein
VLVASSHRFGPRASNCRERGGGSSDQNLWMSLGEAAQERAHLPEDALKTEVVLIRTGVARWFGKVRPR